MVQEGTYSEFLKSWVYFDSLLKKKEKGKPSTVNNQTSSELSVQSQESSRPLVKDAAPEDQDVSFSSYIMP